MAPSLLEGMFNSEETAIQLTCSIRKGFQIGMFYTVGS